MVQKKVYVQRQADNLKIGDLFCHWAVTEDGIYPEPRPIQSIHIFKNKILIHMKLDGEEEIKELLPAMIVVIREVA